MNTGNPNSRWLWSVAVVLLVAMAHPAFAQPHDPVITFDENGPLPHSDQDGCDEPDVVGPNGIREGECKILYVDSNATGANTGYCWRDALTDLCEALDIVENDPEFCEIWVADGSYSANCGSGANGAFDLPDGVSMLGGFNGSEALRSQRNPDPDTNGTVLTGQQLMVGAMAPIGGRPQTTHVVTMFGASRQTLLSGFTIVGGAASDGGDPLGDRGGAMLIVDGAPRIRNCVIQGGHADYAGGGVYISGGEPVLRNVSFRDNVAAFGGALMADAQSLVTLISCDFEGNTAYEHGGAAALDGDVYARITNTEFISNQARHGGGLAITGGAIGDLTNVVFTENTADSAGTILLQESGTALLTNLTIVANTAIEAGGVLVLNDARLWALNAILWANVDESGAGESAQIQVRDTASAAIDYSCVAGWTGAFPGVGVIDVDPLLVDLRLDPTSPCIDAGANPLTYSSFANFGDFGRRLLDLDGQPRLVDDPFTPDTGDGGTPMIDIGAYEHQAALNGGRP